MKRKKPIRQAQGKPKYKIRLVAGRRVYLDTDIYYDPKILNATLMIKDGRVTGRNKKTLKLFSVPRYIMKAKKGELVDHRNRKRLDNRRENLRIATARENNLNRRLKSNTGLIGVTKIRDKKSYRYGASFRPKKGKKKYFYAPFTPKGLKLAALARDKFVLEAGDEEFAPLNFPIFKNEPFKTILLRSDLNEYRQTISTKRRL
ncbi:MAG: HNH endonuclease [Phycisphaerae bacterium]|nr:HNH endonuclease [Phycisphaerae bacterium]